jgi:hypothetical protein
VADQIGRNVGVHLDAFAGQDLLDQLAGLGLFERQQPRLRLDHGDLRAEAREDLGQFGADGPAAEHDHRFRHLLGLDDLPVGPVGRARQALDGRDGRCGAAGDDDAFTGAEHPRADRHLTGTGDGGVPADQVPALAGEPVGRHLVVPVVGGFLPDPQGDR